MPYGFREGALGVLLLGVRDKGIRFETTYRNNTQALYQTAKSMQNIGHIVELEAAPEAIACFVSSLVFRPVILLMEETGEGKEKKLALHAYCGRSLFSGFAIRRAVKRLEKELPKQIKRKGK